MTETVVNKLRLKNIIDKTWDELLNPKYRNTEKKIALSTLILTAFVFGLYFSLAMLVAGRDILLQSGVPKLLLMKATGIIVCLGGFSALRITWFGSVRALRNVFYSKQDGNREEV